MFDTLPLRRQVPHQLITPLFAKIRGIKVRIIDTRSDDLPVFVLVAFGMADFNIDTAALVALELARPVMVTEIIQGGVAMLHVGVSKELYRVP
jgi:hypothetical protein